MDLCTKCKSKLGNFNKSGLCRSCNCKIRYINPIKNPNYKQGRYIKKYFKCIDCGKKLSVNPSKRCNSCENKRRYAIGIMNNKGQKRINFWINKNIIIKHHINLNKKNNRKRNILHISHSNHTKLHLTAYKYLVKKGLIYKYIKWFKKHYLKG